MGRIGKGMKKMSQSSLFGLRIANAITKIVTYFTSEIWSAESVSKRFFKKSFGRDLNLKNPQTLNEKINWLKLRYNVNNDFYTQCADKYGVRDYLAKEFGEEYLIPLLFVTEDYRDLVPENIPDEHCIIKATHDSGGHYLIVRDKTNIDYKRLRENFRFWLSNNYYRSGKEWQYKNIVPRIVIEKLLETKNGKIPNDYKLHFINGELQFIYVSFDREGVNDRCTYDKDWNRLPFVWVPAHTYKPTMNSSIVPRPASLEKMIEFGSRIARNFKYVRVDFYDVDGKLYFGEITLHHGGGCDHFFPDKYDLYYGEKLKLED